MAAEWASREEALTGELKARQVSAEEQPTNLLSLPVLISAHHQLRVASRGFNPEYQERVPTWATVMHPVACQHLHSFSKYMSAHLLMSVLLGAEPS
jgi:hypothetical protein